MAEALPIALLALAVMLNTNDGLTYTFLYL